MLEELSRIDALAERISTAELRPAVVLALRMLGIRVAPPQPQVPNV